MFRVVRRALRLLRIANEGRSRSFRQASAHLTCGNQNGPQDREAACASVRNRKPTTRFWHFTWANLRNLPRNASVGRRVNPRGGRDAIRGISARECENANGPADHPTITELVKRLYVGPPPAQAADPWGHDVVRVLGGDWRLVLVNVIVKSKIPFES
jgi:hypothetical protein